MIEPDGTKMEEARILYTERYSIHTRAVFFVIIKRRVEDGRRQGDERAGGRPFRIKFFGSGIKVIETFESAARFISVPLSLSGLIRGLRP